MAVYTRIALVLLFAAPLAQGIGHGQVGAGEEPPKAGEVLSGPLGLTFVYVPPGKFKMGSDNGDPDEKPCHRVSFAQGFYLQATEVTQGQWKAIMGENPSAFSACGDECPVESVSWGDVQEFLRKLNAADPGKVYRLPSEAEWEYACRAGTTQEAFWKSEAPESYCWYDVNSDRTPHPVRQKQPNPWGLYDMMGNVWEWCEDAYHGSYSGAPTDGIAWMGGGEENRYVAHGGSWSSNGWSIRSSNRQNYPKDLRYSSLGFRVVREKK